MGNWVIECIITQVRTRIPALGQKKKNGVEEERRKEEGGREKRKKTQVTCQWTCIRYDFNLIFKALLRSPSYSSSCVLLWDDLSVCCDMYSSHWLIIKAVWPIVRQDRVRWNNQTENSNKEGQSQAICQPVPRGTRCIRAQVKPRDTLQNIDEWKWVNLEGKAT